MKYKFETDKLCTRADTGLSRYFMYYFRMILQVHFACQGSITSQMGACDRLIFWMMAEVFTLEVLVQVAAAVKRP